MRTLAVLRPEPGNAATVARARAAGFATLSLPLFAVRAIAWDVPDPARHDALILTSANALRFGGPGLAALRHLPVFAVGTHTADAARGAGFDVMATGDADGAALLALAAARGVSRALYVTGRDRTLAAGGPIGAVLPVYENATLPLGGAALEALIGKTSLLHSARAARHLRAMIEQAGIDRARIAIAAFSATIDQAAGPGWAARTVAATPDDAALFAAIRATLAET